MHKISKLCHHVYIFQTQNKSDCNYLSHVSFLKDRRDTDDGKERKLHPKMCLQNLVLVFVSAARSQEGQVIFILSKILRLALGRT